MSSRSWTSSGSRPTGLLLVIAAVMLRNAIFSRATAYAGLIAGVFMMAPSSAGMLDTYMALVSLLPWMVFSVLVTRRFFQLGRNVSASAAGQEMKGEPA